MQFEELPNELIYNIFQYFHVNELLKIFYNLNIRLNNLIKSIHNLCLIISKENHHEINQYQIFSSYLYTLKINEYFDINLFLFNQIRALILINPINKLFSQFNIYQFNYLEYLSINCTNSLYQISDLYQINFPKLKIFYYFTYDTIQIIDNWIISFNLRILKIGYIKLSSILKILSIYPNLYYLDFGIIFSNDSNLNIKQNLNLKHLIIRTSYNNLSTNQNISFLKDLFISMPNLEKLSLHRKDNISIIRKSFIKYDWFSSIIDNNLPNLRRFYCYFRIFRIGNGKIFIGPNLKNNLEQIKENFYKIHKNRYYAKLIID